MVVEWLAPIGKAIKLAKDARKFFDSAEAKLVHAELISALADAKLQTSEMQEEILKRDQRIAKLEAVKNLNLRFDGTLFFEENDSTHPYCPKCYQGKDHLPVQMTKDKYYFRCPVCTYCHQHTDAPNPNVHRDGGSWMRR